MIDLKAAIGNIPNFPKPGIMFRDISPLLRNHLAETIERMSALLTNAEWTQVDALAGIESRGFVLAAALATRHQKGLVMARKKGKLPPPTVSESYSLEYGNDALEMKPGHGRVLLVDDVLATGGTMRAAANLCVSAGYNLMGLIVLIDLGLVKDFTCQRLHVRSAIRYET